MRVDCEMISDGWFGCPRAGETLRAQASRLGVFSFGGLMTRKKKLLWLFVVGLIAAGQVLGDIAVFIFLPVAYLFRGEKTNFLRVMRMPVVAVILIVYYTGLVASVLIFDVNLARADLVTFFLVLFGPVFVCGFVSDLMEGREG